MRFKGPLCSSKIIVKQSVSFLIICLDMGGVIGQTNWPVFTQLLTMAMDGAGCTADFIATLLRHNGDKGNV